jgi:hypothetical protein
MVELTTMLKSYEDIGKERDKKIDEAVEQIKEIYAKKQEEFRKEIKKELDAQIRGLS